MLVSHWLSVQWLFYGNTVVLVDLIVVVVVVIPLLLFLWVVRF